MELKGKRRLRIIVCIAVCLACLAACVLPLPILLSTNDEQYSVAYADGSLERVNYATAFASFEKIEEGNIVVKRGDRVGRIALGERAKNLLYKLNYAPLAELLSATDDGLNDIERAVIFATFDETLFCDGDIFRWTGRKLERTTDVRAKEVVLLSGELPTTLLSESGATKLVVKRDAVLRAKAFFGSAVCEVKAEAPYEVEGGGVYLNGAVGRRLVTVLSNVTQFSASCDYIDYYAMVACRSLTSLTLPFGGSACSALSENYIGELNVLFTKMNESPDVTATLKRVEITGGTLTAYAFYGMNGVEEITVCHMQKEAISNYAFSKLPSLRRLHTPNAEVELSGEFSTSVLPCGCTLFERA